MREPATGVSVSVRVKLRIVLTLNRLLLEKVVGHLVHRIRTLGQLNNRRPVFKVQPRSRLWIYLSKLLNVMTNVPADIDNEWLAWIGIIQKSLWRNNVQPAGLVCHDTAHDMIERCSFRRIVVIVCKQVSLIVFCVLEDTILRVSDVGIACVLKIIWCLIENWD